MTTWSAFRIPTHFRAAALDFLMNRSALIVLALFLIAGLLVLDDYGVTIDEGAQRKLGFQTADFILGRGDTLPQGPTKVYGVVFELPLVVVEKVLGLEDPRAVHLSRHLLTHLLFLVGGFFCSLLAYRLFNSRLASLFALLLFLLHPRLYAHSFFNTKDIPFLSVFMISLFLIHRAFRKDTLWAFALCGVSVGILTNLRVMGVMLFAAVLAMRVLDLFNACGWEGRRRVLTTGGLFALTSALSLYVTTPGSWTNPISHLAEAMALTTSHPVVLIQLFQSTMVASTEPPPHYLSTWFAIPTPPVTLALGAIGASFVLYRSVTRRGDVFRNTALRFGFLLVACFVLPVLAVAVLHANIYDGWRHMYFIYAPFSLMAVLGLHTLASGGVPASRIVRRMLAPYPLRGRLFAGMTNWRKLLRPGIYGLTGVGVAYTLLQMVLIHFYQQVYFNFLVDRTTPEYLRTQYEMEYWGASLREGFEYLVERYPSGPIYVKAYSGDPRGNADILPASDGRRIVIDSPQRLDFHVTHHRRHLRGKTYQPFIAPIYTRKIYNNTIMTVAALDLSFVDETTADAVRETYRSVVSREPVARSSYDIYLSGNTLNYVKDDCRADEPWRFFLHVIPVDLNDLNDHNKPYAVDNLDFSFRELGVRFDGKCWAAVTLPDYDIARVRTGQ